MIPQICAWCWAKGQLVILNGSTWERVMMAQDDKTLSHGMCEECAAQYREESKRRAS